MKLGTEDSYLRPKYNNLLQAVVVMTMPEKGQKAGERGQGDSSPKKKKHIKKSIIANKVIMESGTGIKEAK